MNGAFLDFLAQVGRDYKDSSSPYFGQNARAYTAISTLFPAGSGYTDNSLSSGGNAAPKVATGKLNVAASLLETQMGGDINIIGPGGGLTVGHTSLDTLTPNQEGILTLAGGTIRAFTDDSILVNQSRIMTQQGGDVDLFVANGDINAGSGPKTYASSPAVSLICTVYGYCYTNPQGLVTGAGIAALVTLPGQDPADSNVTLVAPRGTIDLGSAGRPLQRLHVRRACCSQQLQHRGHRHRHRARCRAVAERRADDHHSHVTHGAERPAAADQPQRAAVHHHCRSGGLRRRRRR